MQTFKVICVALLCVAVAAQPFECDGSCDHEGVETTSPEWYENAVFYQIYPRSFKDSDGNGIGDIRGIIEKLDYLQELGIDGTWLSPIFKSPQVDFGYDISDFYKVDERFGTNEDLFELFAEAKKRNIKIILDFVPNHSSDQHEWFKKSVKKEGIYTDFYIWAKGKNNNTEPPTNWVSIFSGPAWTFNEVRGEWYYHNFAIAQPDLNYRNPEVVKEMKNVLTYWVGKGASGFRIDAINHLFEVEKLIDEPLSGLTTDKNASDYTLRHYTKDLPEMYEMVYDFRKVVDDFTAANNLSNCILMTEAYANETEYPKYFKSKDGRLGSHMPFNFVLISDLERSSSPADFKKVIDDRIASVENDTRLNWVMGNHDKPRVASRYGERRAEGLLQLVMTLPGMAVTYNGEEIGMVDYREISYNDTLDPAACNLGSRGDWIKESRDPERTPFQWDSSPRAGFMENSTVKPWLPVHPNYREVNVAVQNATQRSTLNLYKQLVQLRKENTFAYGSYESHVLNEEVFAYVRALEGNATYVVLINFGAQEETVDVSQLTEKMPEDLELAVVNSDSVYVQGEKVKANGIVLRKYDSIILSGSSSVIASMILTFGLLFASIVRNMF